MAWLLESFRRNGFCDSTNSSTIVIGGTNKGELAYAAAKGCAGAKIIGFDIQRAALKMAKKKLAGYAGRIRLIHQGWSDTSGSMTLSTPWDGSEVASLFDATGSKDVEGSRIFSKKWLLRRTVNVTTLAIVGNSTRELQNGALYVLIDTEGHEPRVIRGMELAREENQVRYPLFQYEVGATWGRGPARPSASQRFMDRRYRGPAPPRLRLRRLPYWHLRVALGRLGFLRFRGGCHTNRRQRPGNAQEIFPRSCEAGYPCEELHWVKFFLTRTDTRHHI